MIYAVLSLSLVLNSYWPYRLFFRFVGLHIPIDTEFSRTKMQKNDTEIDRKVWLVQLSRCYYSMLVLFPIPIFGGMV